MMSIHSQIRLLITFTAAHLLATNAISQDDFRVLPYLQHPTQDSISILWFSEDATPGFIRYNELASSVETTMSSIPVLVDELAYSQWENDTFFGGDAPDPPYFHRVRLGGLSPGATYEYAVEQGGTNFSATFKAAPGSEAAIRFMVFGDSETEPESTGKPTRWVDPATGTNRDYLLDQTLGFANNLATMQDRKPDFVAIAGDLVESGGEQRDWDEFWRHLTRPGNPPGLAGQVPILAAPGNHEYFEGPSLGRFDQPGSERAISRFRTYFEFPANGSQAEEQRDRYFRLDYGPVTLIGLDVANNSPHRSDDDTNFFLLGENDAGGGQAPAFSAGSTQYNWLETQLQQAQANSKFTFVIFHHVPYSVGPHGWPAGEGENFDTQSGVPVRTLTPLFMRYGVDAVLAGHDEMWERSEIMGIEVKPGGTEQSHTLHIFDVGIGGDGLRAPVDGLENAFQQFLAHDDAPEVWQEDVLVDGGKHYGHLEVDVEPLSDGSWQATLRPIYVFPLFSDNGSYLGFERRIYDDVVTLTHIPETAVPVELALFTSTVERDRVILSWETRSETNNLGFEVERSADGKNFATIGFVRGHGTVSVPKKYAFLDGDLEIGRYFYRLRQIDTGGTFSHSSIVQVDLVPPAMFSLAQNYPNPFNPETEIRFELPRADHVLLQVFNTLGQEVRRLVDAPYEAGYHRVRWDARDDRGNRLSNGVYFYRLRAGALGEIKKMSLLR